MQNGWSDSLREKLDQNYSWPALYTFKFIVPKGKEADVKKLFPMHETTERHSKNGNYTSITLEMMVQDADSVIAVYEKVSVVEGIISL